MKKVTTCISMLVFVASLLGTTLTAYAQQANFPTVVDTTYYEKIFIGTPKWFIDNGLTDYPYEVYLPNESSPANYRIHTNYTTDTDACASCHATHTAVGASLLQWTSVYNTCMACHDGTVTTTYNVMEGTIGTSDEIASGGMFGLGNESFLSNHSVYDAVDITSAPGGSILGVDSNGTLEGQSGYNSEDIIAWRVPFGCESCHSPHGQGGNARILHPDPNGIATLSRAPYYENLGSYSGGAVTGYAFVAGTGYQLVVDGEPQLVIKGFPYQLQFYDSTGDVLEGVTADNSGGVTIFTGESSVLSAVYRVYATPSVRVVMEIDNYLQSDETIVYKEGINEFCGACHTDYNTTGQAVAHETHGEEAAGQITTGYYSQAYRHAVGVAFDTAYVSGSPAGVGASPEDYMKLADRTVNNEGPVIICLTCHLAHGVSQDYWIRAIGETDFGTLGKYYQSEEHYDINNAREISGSSALKRKPNMATCESCHQKGADSEGYLAATGQEEYLALATTTNPDFWLSQTIGVEKCLQCHGKYSTWVTSTVGKHYTQDGRTDAQVVCEDCHGPAGMHAQDPYSGDQTIRHPAYIGMQELSQDVCGGNKSCHVGKDGNGGDVNTNYEASIHFLAGVGCNQCHWPHDEGYYAGGDTNLRMSKDALCATCHQKTWDWTSDYDVNGHKFQLMDSDTAQTFADNYSPITREPATTGAGVDHLDTIRDAFDYENHTEIQFSWRRTCSGYQSGYDFIGFNPDGTPILVQDEAFDSCHATNARPDDAVVELPAGQGLVESTHYAKQSLTDPASTEAGYVDIVQGMDNRICEAEGTISALNWLGILEGSLPDGSTSSVPDGCARCHIGSGYRPVVLGNTGERAAGLGDWSVLSDTESGTGKPRELNAIECFICHADIYDPVAGTRDTFAVINRLPAVEGSTTYENMTILLGEGYTDPDTGVKMLYNYDLRESVYASIYKTPSSQACARCHNYAGSGLAVRRGMLYAKSNETLPGQSQPLGKVVDVHAENDVLCVGCHPFRNHKVAAGPLPDLWAADIWAEDDIWTYDVAGTDVSVNYSDYYWDAECNTCHGDRPHRQKILNEHYDQNVYDSVLPGINANDPNDNDPDKQVTEIGDGNPDGRVDCRTCHIPYQHGQMSKDWSKPLFNPDTGLWEPEILDVPVEDIYRPEYRWFNFKGNSDKKGPAPSGRYDFFTGQVNAKNSSRSTDQLATRIFPFHNYNLKLIADPAPGGDPYQLKTDVYYQTGSIELAIWAARNDANPDNPTYILYNDSTGTRRGSIDNVQWTTIQESVNMLLGHRVKPATGKHAETLTCYDCHQERHSVLDWGALGYTEEEQQILRFVMIR